MTLRACLPCLFALGTAPAFATPQDDPATIHIALSAGAGYAYDGLGLRIDARWKRAAVSFASGPFGTSRTSSDIYGSHRAPLLGSWAAGARFFLEDGGGGPFLGGSVMRSEDRLTSPWIAGGFERSVHVVAAIGYRWRLGTFFLEGSAGPVYHYDRQFYMTEPRDPSQPTVTHNIGLLYDTGSSFNGWWFVPALDLGLGAEF